MSYGFGNLHWAAAHVISMAGAFCAGVAVYGFRAANDVPGWQVNVSVLYTYILIYLCMGMHKNVIYYNCHYVMANADFIF